MNTIDDKSHTYIQNQALKYFNKRMGLKETFIEYEYNNYGSRGFIDLLILDKSMTAICEVKPKLINFGEMVRQLIKPYNYFKSKGLLVDRCVIIFEMNKENLQFIYKNIFLFKNTNIPIYFMGLRFFDGVFTNFDDIWFVPIDFIIETKLFEDFTK